MPHIVAKAASDYAELANIWATTPAFQAQPGADDSVAALDEQVEMLLSMPLTWLDADVCDLVEQTFPTVPEWTPAACLPGPVGGVFFEQPVTTVPFEAQTGDQVLQVPLEGFGWVVKGESVRITALSQLHGAREHLSPFRSRIPLHEVVAVTLPLATVTAAGISLEVAAGRGILNTDKMLQAAPLLTSVAGSVWLLMSQPIVADGAPVTAQVKRGRRRAGESARRPVNVSVKHLEGASRPRGGGGRKRRQATSRWWVRGHWRQQAWGPGRKLRKPIFIAPHTAGAKDADVDVRPRVQIVKK
ncbi:MAG TPA: hypothetical protein VFC72_04200 [Corynebacterium sp.]|nr:hypothetical protein [Corynebacterium sp.]